jgi:predicted kinase
VGRAEALLIGGRSGVGKSVVGWEVSARLRAAGVAHAIVEGDFMGQVHPAPADDPHRTRLVERNLTAVWANFAALGHTRLIYTNTLSVMPEATGMFERALGADVRLIRVLLTASDATAHARLRARELGSELADGLRTSDARARVLEHGVPGDTARVPTDDRTVISVAEEIVALTGWCA